MNSVNRMPDFQTLVEQIKDTHQQLKNEGLRSVNTLLTLRNWLIGHYIAEYELKGTDRADYGDKIVEQLSDKLRQMKVPRSTKRELHRFCQFYRMYPQIERLVSAQFPSSSNDNPKQEIGSDDRALPAKQKVRSLSAQLNANVEKIFRSLSYAHFEVLITIHDELKRQFYEVECVRGNWSVRELKRQVHALYFERSALSKDKDKLSQLTHANSSPHKPEDTIRDPYIFEFLGLKAKEILGESQLEDKLLDNLQEFLLELGHGFCFEARQKRILIGDTQFYVDLVFYHRILKCNILVELKLAEFNHENVGQLNTYVSWYRANEMREGDNPPIGILLCTGKDSTLVEYALAGMDNNLFVSQYMLELPSEDEMQAFLTAALKEELS